MVAPFEGLLGDTSELRTIQFLLPASGMRFNISELARETRISSPDHDKGSSEANKMESATDRRKTWRRKLLLTQ